MRAVLLASVAVTVQVCASDPAPEDAVDGILDQSGSSDIIRQNDRVDVAFRETVVDVFARPQAYRWVWTVPPEDNAALALLEVLEGRGVPTRGARILAYSAAKPSGGAPHGHEPMELAGTVMLDETAAGTVIALPERDLWRVPVEQAGVVLGRATSIPCLAALESPQPTYPLGPLPPVTACRALKAWAVRQ